VGLSGAEVASDEQPLRWTRGWGIVSQGTQLASKASLEMWLVRAQEAHSISIWHARPQCFDSSARIDGVDINRRRHGPQICRFSRLDRLAHAAAEMRVRDENGFSRSRS
jgi:hypothetical protein